MQGKLFFIEILFVGHENDRFFLTQIVIFGILRNMAEVRRYSYFELGLPVLTVAYVLLEVKVKARPRWRQGDQWRGKVSDYGTANFMQQTMTVAPGAMIYCAPEALTSNQTVKVSFLEFRAFLIQHCFINTF